MILHEEDCYHYAMESTLNIYIRGSQCAHQNGKLWRLPQGEAYAISAMSVSASGTPALAHHCTPVAICSPSSICEPLSTYPKFFKKKNLHIRNGFTGVVSCHRWDPRALFMRRLCELNKLCRIQHHSLRKKCPESERKLQAFVCERYLSLLGIWFSLLVGLPRLISSRSVSLVKAGPRAVILSLGLGSLPHSL